MRSTSFVSWSDLSPFQQGYIEALFASLNEARLRTPAPAGYTNAYRPKLLGFSDLAPETLAAILKDCAELKRQNPESAPDLVWAVRQAGGWLDFPPLTPTIRDDGKVYLTAQGASK